MNREYSVCMVKQNSKVLIRKNQMLTRIITHDVALCVLLLNFVTATKYDVLVFVHLDVIIIITIVITRCI